MLEYNYKRCARVFVLSFLLAVGVHLVSPATVLDLGAEGYEDQCSVDSRVEI